MESMVHKAQTRLLELLAPAAARHMAMTADGEAKTPAARVVGCESAQPGHGELPPRRPGAQAFLKDQAVFGNDRWLDRFGAQGRW